jgi:hypothetical protein
MKSHAKKAYDKLDALKVSLLPAESGEHFKIWAEDYREGCDMIIDYYCENDAIAEFGVDNRIVAILGQHGLFCEWINPGALAVYDI